MKEFVIYLAQVSLLSACSCLVYKAVFARDTLCRVKRFVLLLLLAASFALPVCRITVVKELETASVSPLAEAYDGPAPLAQAIGAVQPVTPVHDLWLMVGMLYFAGVVSLLAYRLTGVARVRKIMKRYRRKVVYDGIEVLLVAEDISPFSFAGRVVMSEGDCGENADMIVRHEAVHIRERHGLDQVAVNIAQALLWFNPLVWLLRRELILVHEQAADRGVVESGVDAKKYQYLLISKSASGEGLLSVGNHFRTGDLHKRIIAMKRKTSRAAALKLLLLPPLAAIALMAFAGERYAVPEPEMQEPVAEKERFHMPFDGARSAWGLYGKRVHPITGKEILHTGIDVVPLGDTVRAPYSGVVKSTGFDKGAGNRLVIAHAGGLETTYQHLAGFLVGEGARVEGGEPVAIVGATGAATGRHLHLETRVNGQLVDPMKALPLEW